MIYRGFVSRFPRAWSMALIAFGTGSPQSLGAEHPDISLRRINLFPGRVNEAAVPPVSPSSDAAEVWECWLRFLDERLESLQFFGSTYYNAPFFVGLRAVVQTYAFVLAAARIHVAARGAGRIAVEDVQYAVGAVDHSLGRSKLLEATRYRILEHLFARFRYGRLLAALGWE